MAQRRPTTGNTARKRSARQSEVEIPASDEAPPPSRDWLVDLNPWTVLLEQLMGAPAEREDGKGE
jgi:hypothetical protein